MNYTDPRSVNLKAWEMLRELAGERPAQGQSAARAIEKALLAAEYPPEVARDIAFHLTDWLSDADFIVALSLFPERFTPEQIQHGVGNFLVHAPNHTAAAAKLFGFPVTDVFGIGALDVKAVSPQ